MKIPKQQYNNFMITQMSNSLTQHLRWGRENFKKPRRLHTGTVTKVNFSHCFLTWCLCLSFVHPKMTPIPDQWRVQPQFQHFWNNKTLLLRDQIQRFSTEGKDSTKHILVSLLMPIWLLFLPQANYFYELCVCFSFTEYKLCHEIHL